MKTKCNLSYRRNNISIKDVNAEPVKLKKHNFAKKLVEALSQGYRIINLDECVMVVEVEVVIVTSNCS